MALVSGITRSNYDTIGTQRLANAEANLQYAIKNNASDDVLLKLQKTVDDLKNSIAVREKAREAYLSKLSETERRVREAQFDAIKQKFDETNQRAEDNAEKARDSIRKVSETVGGTLDKVFDSVAHTLLGPLNLLVNPLEKAFNFNLFQAAKKPVGDYLQGKFPASYQKLKDNGGLIGAVGVAIVDAIHGVDEKNMDLLSSGGSGFGSLLSGNGFNALGALKTFGIIGLVVAGISFTIAAWKNHWDEKGLVSGEELVELLKDDNASIVKKVLGVGVYLVKAIFGSVVGAIKGLWTGVKKNFDELVEIWTDPNKPVFAKIWDTVKTFVFGIPEILWNGVVGLVSTLGDFIVGLFSKKKNSETGEEEVNQEVLDWWDNFKDHLHGFVDDIFGGLKEFFSWEKIKERWTTFLTDPVEWAQQIVDAIKGWSEKIVTHIVSAFTGDPDIKFSWDDWWDKKKRELEVWWDNTPLNPQNWFDFLTKPEATYVPVNWEDSEGNKHTTTMTQWENSSWNPRNWFTRTDMDPSLSWWDRNIFNFLNWNSEWRQKRNQSVNVNDAIISKDNDLYIPSEDDNIVVTKSDVGVSSQVSNDFQQELMTVLRDIASKLQQPTVINNVAASKAVDFGGLRL